jgi:hemolysin activation/secretion protein
MQSKTPSKAVLATHRLSAARLPWLFLSFWGLAAEAAPDAGSVLQQIQQNIKTQPSGADTQPATRLTPSQPKPGAVTVRVERIEFQGNTLLSTDQLNAVVTPWLQRDLDYAELRKITSVVSAAYREAGWMASVTLPRQEIRDGLVQLQIVEAKFGKTVVQGDQKRVTPQWLEAYVAQAQAPGAPVSSKRIDRALLLLDEVPGLKVTGNFAAGSEAGLTDLTLDASERAAVTGSVTLDNTGSRSTGSERVVGTLFVNSPLGLGDQLGLTALKTQGSTYLRMGMSVPVGYDGWRVGVNASRMTYGLVGEFQSLDSNGSAYSQGLDASYPLVRSQQTNVRLTGSYDTKHFDNNAHGASASNYRIGVWSMGLNASQNDTWQGGGTNTLTLNVSQGNSNLNGSANQDTDAKGPATAGRFSKFNVGLNRLQNLTSSLSAYVGLNIQRANKNLDSSERLYLGGANGVRAYPGSEGGGTEGQVLVAELRQTLGEQALFTGFYEYGQVQAFKNQTWADGSGRLNAGTAPNNVTLQGFGVSLTYKPLPTTELRATLARRIGSNPLANTTTGADGDGTHTLNRLWLNATLSF